MKIINKTGWQTKHLLAFAAWAAKREIDDAGKRKRLVVTFKNCRGGVGIHGNAYVGGVRSTIFIPPVGTREIDKAGLMMVLCHEFAHNRGLSGEHSMRKSGRYGWKDKTGKPAYREIYAFAKEYALEAVAKASKQPVNVAEKTEQEIAKIETAMARWRSKEKRCKTALAKYGKMLKYRQTKLAAIAAGEIPAVKEPVVRAPRPIAEKLVAPATWPEFPYSQKFLRAVLPFADHLDVEGQRGDWWFWLSGGLCFEQGLHVLHEDSPAKLLEGMLQISVCECEDCQRLYPDAKMPG
jgi:hypothetical protein